MCGSDTSILTIGILLILIISVVACGIRKQLFAIIPILLLLPFNNTSLVLLFIFLLTYLSIYVDLKDIAKNTAIVSVIFVVLNYFLFSLGFIEETFSDLVGKGKDLVSDYGYGNPNTFSIFIFTILLSFYLLKKNHNFIFWIVFMIVSYTVYYFVRSRTVFFTELFFLFICNLQDKKIGKLFYNKKVLYLIPIVILSFIIYSINFTKTDPTLDYFFSFRFSRSYDIISMMNIYNIFIGYSLEGEKMIDISYCYLFFAGGVVGIFYFLFLYFKFVGKVDLNSYHIPVVLSFLVLGISESVMMSTYFLGGLYIWFILYRTVYGISK